MALPAYIVHDIADVELGDRVVTRRQVKITVKGMGVIDAQLAQDSLALKVRRKD